MGVDFKMPSFAAGEVSDKISARDDTERYHIGLAKCRNFRVMKEGGVEKAPGLRFVGKVKSPTKYTRVVGLERDANTTHALEFGDLYVRIWKDRANVLQLAAHDPEEQLQLVGADYVWVASGSGTDEWYLTSSYGGPAEIFGEPTSVKRHTPPAGPTDVFAQGTIGALAADEYAWGDNDDLGFSTLYVRDAAVDLNDHVTNGYRMIIPGPLEYVTPYAEADLKELRFDSSASILYITSNDHPPAQLARTSDTDWAYSVIDFDTAGTPVDTYLFSAEFGPVAPVSLNWAIEYAVTRLSEEGIESATKNLSIMTANAPTVNIPELGQLGPVWDLDATDQGDPQNIIVNAADYEWIDAGVYTGVLDPLPNTTIYFLAKKGTGLDGPLATGTNLAEDPGVFDDVPQTGPVQCFDVTGSPLLLTRVRKGQNILDYISNAGDTGYDGVGLWCWGVSAELINSINNITPLVPFKTLWYITAGTATPLGKNYELTIEQNAGYNLYRRYSKITPFDGIGGAQEFPWGRLAALDASGGTLRVKNADHTAYPNAATEKSQIDGAYYDSSFVTTDESREPPELLNAFNQAGEYPIAVGFLGQRFVLAGTANAPNQLRLSASGDFVDFVQADTSEDDDPIMRDLTTASRILHLVSAGTGSMVVFTAGSEWRVWGEGGPVTPSTINTAEAGKYGTTHVAPLKIGGLVLYVTKLAKAVNAIRFNLAEENYKSNEVSAMSDHLIETSGIEGWCYAESKNKTIYIHLDDGSMVGVTFNEEQQMNAWWTRDSSGGFVVSNAAVRAVTQDDVYCIVKRTIDGSEQQYMEVIENGDQSNQGQAFYVDSGLSLQQPELPFTSVYTQSGSFILAAGVAPGAVLGIEVGDELVVGGFAEPPIIAGGPPHPINLFMNGRRVKVDTVNDGLTNITITELDGTPVVIPDEVEDTFPVFENFYVRKLVKTIYGLDHLEGETVAVLADGRDVGTHVVTNAGFTLADGAADVVAGLPIESELETLDFSGSAGQSTLDGKKKNINEVIVHMLRSIGLKIGLTRDSVIPFKVPTQPTLNLPRPLYTGKKRMTMQGEWTETGKVFIVHDSPQPASVLSITPEFELGD